MAVAESVSDRSSDLWPRCIWESFSPKPNKATGPSSIILPQLADSAAHNPFDAGTLLSLDVQCFRVCHRTKPLKLV